MDTSLAVLPGGLSGYANATPGAAIPARPPVRTEGVAPVPPLPGSGAESSNLAARDYGQLRSRQDELNSLAQDLRQNGRSVDIRKLFPPYPPEQEARMAYLDQVSGLRRQIEALMYPAPSTSDLTGRSQDQISELAQGISQDSRAMLAALSSKQSISSNRPLLEVVAQIDPVQ